MRRYLIVFFIFALIVTLAACDTPNVPQSTEPTPVSEEPQTISSATAAATTPPPTPESMQPSETPEVEQSTEPTPVSDEPNTATSSGSSVAVGELTGNDALDAEALAIIEKVCSPDATLEENLWSCFDWMVTNLKYQGIAVDLSNGYTDELVFDLAEYIILKLRGSCEHQAALFNVFARLLGCETQVVAGEFLSDDGAEWVEHAWVITNVDGKYRHFDVLFGRNHSGGNPRSMFMQTDQSIVRHRWDTEAYPACE